MNNYKIPLLCFHVILVKQLQLKRLDLSNLKFENKTNCIC